MIIDKVYECAGCDDVELGIARSSRVEYRVSWDDEKEPAALVFIIGGFGSNKNMSFVDFDRHFVARKFPVVAISVLYHCYCLRPGSDEKYSAIHSFSAEDSAHFRGLCQSFGMDISGLNAGNAMEYLAELDALAGRLKKAGRLPPETKLIVKASCVPGRGEYQNFGLMAAVDHINALKDLYRQEPWTRGLPRIYGGGSYGGYVALMISKIAPFYTEAVVENSGSPLPPGSYLLGREMGKPDMTYNDDRMNYTVYVFTDTHWTREEGSPYFFAPYHYKIRSLPLPEHLRIQHEANPDTIFISYHSAKDEWDTAKDKELLFKLYESLGFEARLHLIRDESEVDGKVIKNLKHGLRMGDRQMFGAELGGLLEKLVTRKVKKGPAKNEISYPCGERIFKFKDRGRGYVLEISG